MSVDMSGDMFGMCPHCPHCNDEMAESDDPRAQVMGILGEMFAGLFNGDAGEARARAWLSFDAAYVVDPMGIEVRPRE